MFSRKRAQSNPPAKTPPTAAASTAAVQAFLASRGSNANLSNAAAAAALRSHTTSPVPVGAIQTKRMQRRGSTSSNGSGNGSVRGGLQRQNSSGSMTERSFRDPSPNRKSSSSMRVEDPPPVPALPKNYMSPLPVPVKSGRRAASVEPPERVSSPPPRASGRGVSLDRGPGMLPGKGDIRSYYKPRITSLDEERASSRESVNFSRPMSPQNSPPSSPLAGKHPKSALTQPAITKIGDKPTADVGQTWTQKPDPGRLPEGEAQNILYRLQETAARPVKKKKKSVGLEGSHLAAGGSGAKATGTAVEATPQRQSQSTLSTPSPSNSMSQPPGIVNSSSAVPKKKKKKIVPAEGLQTSSYASDSDSAMSDLSSSAERPRNYNTRAAGLLTKQPSIVRENREAEEQEEQNLSGKRMNGHKAQNGNFGTEAVAAGPQLPTNGRLHKKSASQPASSIATSLASEKAISLDTSNAGTTIRHQSLSPARAAHFSSQPILETPEGQKHQPPARSVSPAKSALKHSPSSRGPSPMPGSWNRTHGKAASEASDTTSMVSDDGARSAPKKKKTVRVSFDDDSLAVGRAASPPTSPDSLLISSPQNKELPNKGRINLDREARQDQDTAIKPTPTLPSFGSVRGWNDLSDLPAGQRSSRDKSGEHPSVPNVSSDLAIGGIISQHLRNTDSSSNSHTPFQKIVNDPLPPEVTSVEGTGNNSDSEAGLYSDREDQIRTSLPVPDFDPVVLGNGNANGAKHVITSSTSEGESSQIMSYPVPSIAVQPATPGLEDFESDHEEWFGMPGGFPASKETQDRTPKSSNPIVEHHATDPTPASIGIAEPEPEEAHHEPGSPVVGEVAEGLRIQIESDHEDSSADGGSSIYSDAAEDLSDLEGDGFGSINAIIESPGASPAASSMAQLDSPSKRDLTFKTTRPSPLARNESETSEPAQEEGWDRAQQYWSGLSSSRKQQLEKAATSESVDQATTEPKVKSKKKKVVAKKPIQMQQSIQEVPFPPWPDKQYREDISRSAAAKVPAIKKSTRQLQPEPAQEIHMRSSMRKGAPREIQTVPSPEIHMRSSMRNRAPAKSSMRNSQPPEPRGALQKKTRPMSAVAMVDYNKTQDRSTPNHGRAASANVSSKALTPVLAQQNTKPIRRIASNGSDSSSSFKKARPISSESNRYTMKRSMRNGSVDSRPQSVYANRASSLGARSPSPSGSTMRRPFSSVGPGSSSIGGPGMRTSMRGSVEPKKQNRTKSPIRSFGFGKGSKPTPAASNLTSRFSSRFGDSSDEEDGPRIMGSRFADSSDDEGPIRLTRVRGIPRRTDEGDSTDLEDSSEGPPNLPKSKPSTKKSPPPKLEGAALATGSLRGPNTAGMGSGLQAERAAEQDKKKRSFFGALGSRRRDDSKVRKSDIESAARRDTPLERTRAERAMSPLQESSSPRSPKAERILGPGSPTTSSQAQSPKSPKLQRRNTPARLMSDSWPLPAPPSVMANNSRPNTSDGGTPGVMDGVRGGRPDLGTRRSTVQSEALNGMVLGKGGKKKRFPMLRRAFRLHD